MLCSLKQIHEEPFDGAIGKSGIPPRCDDPFSHWKGGPEIPYVL
jgi:hypothetical protein